MKYCIRLQDTDNVATVLAQVNPGDTLSILDANRNNVGSIRAEEDIPFAHKIGLLEIGEKEDVIKFGERIGRTTSPIPKGGYMHVHNVISMEGSPQMIDGLGEIG